MLTNRPSLRTILEAASRCLTRTAASNAERGVATFIAAMLALLATGTTAATLTLANGDVNFDAVGDVIERSVGRVSGTLEVRGSVVARSEDGATVSTVHVPVRLYGDAPSVSFDPGAPERLVIAYYDADVYLPDVTYTPQMLTGNGDGILDAWETALITIDLAGSGLHGGERFTLELSAPVGGTVIVQRTVPPIPQPLMSLY